MTLEEAKAYLRLDGNGEDVLLARLIEEKIIDPRPVPELRLRDLDKIATILKPVPVPPSTDAAAPPTS